MKTYSVTLLFTGSKYFGEVRANSEDEAKQIALCSEKNHASLCHQCSDEVELDDYCAQDAIAIEAESAAINGVKA